MKVWAGLLAVLIIAAEAKVSASDERHCIQEVTAMTAEREALGLDSAVGEPECFDTEAEALAAAGNVGGGGGGGGARYGFCTWYSIYKIWAGDNFTGESHLFYNTTGCSGYFWYNDLNNIGWNDIASSAATYRSHDVDLYQHTYLMGDTWGTYVADRKLGNGLDNEGSSWDTAD